MLYKLVLILMFQDAYSTQCEPGSVSFCGDMCIVSSLGICKCSNETLLPWSENPVCCVQDGGCTKSYVNGNEIIECPNGLMQSIGSYCESNDRCLTWYAYEHSTKCKIGNESKNCSRIDRSDVFCRGVPICEEYNEEEQLECENKQDDCPQELFFNCPQVPNSRFKNHECQDNEYLSSNHFDCLNRMDEADTMFTKTTYKTKKPSPNLSKQLDFDEDGVNCTRNNTVIKLAWNSNDLMELYPLFPQVEYIDGCLTKDGDLIERMEMFYLLLKDQSFSGRSLIPEDWLLAL